MGIGKAQHKTAVDPLLASGKSADPQTFNRYVYVMNQPLKFTDPSGLQAGSPRQDIGIYDVDVPISSSRVIGDRTYNVSNRYGSFERQMPVYDTAYTPWTPQMQAFQDYQADYHSFGKSAARGWLKGAANFIPETINFATRSLRAGIERNPYAMVDPFHPSIPTIPYENTTEAVAGISSGIFHGFAFGSITRMATIKEGVSGTAIVRTTFPRNKMHFSVEVQSSSESFATNLVYDSSTKLAAVKPASTKEVLSRTINLPNPQGALQYQRALSQQPNVGRYDYFTNSCLTHVCGTLRAGGLSTPRATLEGFRLATRAQVNRLFGL